MQYKVSNFPESVRAAQFMAEGENTKRKWSLGMNQCYYLTLW